MFTEDLNLFLGEFAVPCMAGATAFKGLIDQPDELIDLPRATAQSRQYELTYPSASVTLTHGQAITVNGVAYTVREHPRALDDGAFTAALLSKA